MNAISTVRCLNFSDLANYLLNFTATVLPFPVYPDSPWFQHPNKKIVFSFVYWISSLTASNILRLAMNWISYRIRCPSESTGSHFETRKINELINYGRHGSLISAINSPLSAFIYLGFAVSLSIPVNPGHLAGLWWLFQWHDISGLPCLWTVQRNANLHHF